MFGISEYITMKDPYDSPTYIFVSVERNPLEYYHICINQVAIAAIYVMCSFPKENPKSDFVQFHGE